ncbi:MAG: cytochrome c peroxidase [Vicingaceae bacterium]
MRSVAFLVMFAFTFLSFSPGDLTPYPFPGLSHFPPAPLNLQNPVTLQGVELGRHLFYDTILSLDQDLSCASCHRQEQAFSDAPNRFTKGSKERMSQRNTLALFNLAWRKNLFWDGKSVSLEEQVFHPVRGHEEMNLTWVEAENRIRSSESYQVMYSMAFPGEEIDSIHIAYAIAQFERTLISHNSKYDKVLRGEAYFTLEERDGFILMNDQTKGNCLHCHPSDGSAVTTTGNMSNNGLDDVVDAADYPDKGYGEVTKSLSDNGKFRIPALRNLAFTAPYMHDGRFESLEAVLKFYAEDLNASVNIDSRFHQAHQGGVNLNAEEQQQVIAFLNTLNDSVFVKESKFSSPFQK